MRPTCGSLPVIAFLILPVVWFRNGAEEGSEQLVIGSRTDFGDLSQVGVESEDFEEWRNPIIEFFFSHN